MPDLIEEVEEELRQERQRALLRRFAGLAAAAALLVLAAVGGWQGWLWWEGRRAEAAATAYLAILREAAQEGADLPALASRLSALAEEAPAGYRTLALLRAAALAAAAGDVEGALGMWNRLAADRGADPLYRDLALLMWGLHALSPARAAEVEARLAGLAAGGPWQASARELRAIAALLRGDGAEARRRLAELSADERAPEGIRERAQRLLGGLEG
ncbi:MAG: tetratricopeptide repeat protein [Rhodovarius sp.]|nr:tetratricopeptide repeat protein [Rhodovarius sp.]